MRNVNDGLTVQQALATGKPLKRPQDQDWYLVVGGDFINPEGNGRCFNVEDLMAEDWQVKD